MDFVHLEFAFVVVAVRELDFAFPVPFVVFEFALVRVFAWFDVDAYLTVSFEDFGFAKISPYNFVAEHKNIRGK